MSTLSSAWQRLWQPSRGTFWLVLAFNGLSSALVWWVHLNQPTLGLRLFLSVLALVNAALGWWLAIRLWRESAPPS